MKYRLSITLLLINALSMQAAPREPNRKYLETMRQQKRKRGIQEAATACMAVENPMHSRSTEVVIGGSISMPLQGQAEGEGTGFSYVADAESATIVITFEQNITGPVTASAHDLEETRKVTITEHNERSVTLHIHEYTAGNPTVLEFNVLQSENA